MVDKQIRQQLQNTHSSIRGQMSKQISMHTKIHTNVGSYVYGYANKLLGGCKAKICLVTKCLFVFYDWLLVRADVVTWSTDIYAFKIIYIRVRRLCHENRS